MNNNRREAFRTLVEQRVDLPSIPSSIMQINTVLDDPESTVADLTDALGQDQSIALRLLRIVNSAFFGFPRQIETLEHAVTILGYRAVREIVLATSLMAETAGNPNSDLIDRKQFWLHAVGCGAASKIMARRTGAAPEDQAFLGGLLHDIGKVFLDAFLHEEYLRAVSVARKDNQALLFMEDRVLGVNHTDFGYWLAESWNLPPSLASAIIYHHNPAEADDYYYLACLVHLGDILVRALDVGDGGDDIIPVIDKQAWSSLGLGIKALEEVLPEFDLEMEKSRVWL